MKTKIASIYTFLAVMILSIGISSLQAKDDSEKADVRIPLSEETTLVVKYAEQTAGNSESTRFGFFQEAFSAALKDANLSPEVKFIQRGFDKATEGDHFLTITISMWGPGMRGDYECSFWASISTTE
ncbi:MAG: hypothetical protein JKY51_10610, partial [Opitutaceae bacterium]|nr:hypothetical protein [Opitutaceae bacterium]